MAKTKKFQISDFQTVLNDRYGELSDEQVTELMSALVASIGVDPSVEELTADQYHLGVQVVEVAATGQAESFQQAREMLTENPSILSEKTEDTPPPAQDGRDHIVDSPKNDLPAAITRQGGKLFGKIPETFSRQEQNFAAALDQAVIADLNARIQNGDLDAVIEDELGKGDGEAPPSFVEMLGLGTTSSVPTLPESSTE